MAVLHAVWQRRQSHEWTYILVIPGWTSQCVLPPCDLDDPASLERSPYVVSTAEFVQRFAISPDRNTILQGFLDFRRALNGIGLVQGFQWVDGSFVEDVEHVRDCSPHDIDVVTFYYSADRLTQNVLLSCYPYLFDARLAKKQYHVDAHVVELNVSTLDTIVNQTTLVNQTAYWYSLWSHRREDLLWKGYLQLDLLADNDPRAPGTPSQAIQGSLDQATDQGGQP
jgi:hypothetical protein